MNHLLKETKCLLRKYSFNPRKRWGQNFLIDEEIISKIIDASSLSLNDTVIEIGAGIGTLTQALSTANVDKIVAIEIDPKLVEILITRFKEDKHITIVANDILKIEIKELIDNPSATVKIVANLPYYITTPTLEYLIKQRPLWKSLVVMIQHEVAERIMAKPSETEYGSLSIFIQYYMNVSRICEVCSESFYPQPEVSSTVLKLIPHERKCVDYNDEERFFGVVRTAFSKRRKMIVNALCDTIGTKEEVTKLLTRVGINPAVRPQDLNEDDFLRLSKCIGSGDPGNISPICFPNCGQSAQDD